MMQYILDTNVISELTKSQRNQNFRNWIGSLAAIDLYLSVISIGEMRKGIEMLRPRDAERATNLETWLTRLLSIYSGRILPFDQDVADRWGKVMALHPSMPVLDTQIAATALHHGMTVATRNVRDFVNSGVPVYNPF